MLVELREILKDYAAEKERLLNLIETYATVIQTYSTHVNELEMQNKLLEERLAGPIYDC